MGYGCAFVVMCIVGALVGGPVGFLVAVVLFAIFALPEAIESGIGSLLGINDKPPVHVCAVCGRRGAEIRHNVTGDTFHVDCFERAAAEMEAEDEFLERIEEAVARGTERGLEARGDWDEDE